MKLASLAGKRVAGWGAGVDMLTTIKAAQTAGAQVCFALDDKLTGEETIEGVRAFYGDEAAKILLEAEVVIKSPGISPLRPLHKRISEKHIPITSSADLWLGEYHARAIAITGSKGKSTTAALIAHLLRACGKKVELAGNIGIPFFSLPKDSEWFVLELSSYQCHSLTVSPQLAVLTSLFPEHLTWHGSEQAYYDAKLNMVSHGPEAVIASSENQILKDLLPRVIGAERIQWVPSSHISIDDGRVFVDGKEYISSKNTTLVGRHNMANLSLCLAVLERVGVSLSEQQRVIRDALKTFQPLAHRLQEVSTAKGLQWISDSLATNPQATIAALEAFKDQPVTVLVGGHDRGLNYEVLRDYLAQRAQPIMVITLPDNGPQIADLLSTITNHKIVSASSLDEAVAMASKETPSGGVVLLSPGAPSFGQFKDYADRGDQFQRAAERV